MLGYGFWLLKHVHREGLSFDHTGLVLPTQYLTIQKCRDFYQMPPGLLTVSCHLALDTIFQSHFKDEILPIIKS